MIVQLCAKQSMDTADRLLFEQVIGDVGGRLRPEDFMGLHLHNKYNNKYNNPTVWRNSVQIINFLTTPWRALLESLCGQVCPFSCSPLLQYLIKPDTNLNVKASDESQTAPSLLPAFYLSFDIFSHDPLDHELARESQWKISSLKGFPCWEYPSNGGVASGSTGTPKGV
jgi:hypothetical protein